jgi:hypothetical protein
MVLSCPTAALPNKTAETTVTSLRWDRHNGTGEEGGRRVCVPRIAVYSMPAP